MVVLTAGVWSVKTFDNLVLSLRYINSDSAVSGEVGPQEDMASSAPEHSIHSVLPLRFVFARYCCRHGFVGVVVVVFFVLWTFVSFLHTLPILCCCSTCCSFICLLLCPLFVIVCVNVVCAANMLQTTWLQSQVENTSAPHRGGWKDQVTTFY